MKQVFNFARKKDYYIMGIQISDLEEAFKSPDDLDAMIDAFLRTTARMLAKYWADDGITEDVFKSLEDGLGGDDHAN